MASSADRVQAYLDRLDYKENDNALLSFAEDIAKLALTVGDLRALQAQHAALWAVVRAADILRHPVSVGGSSVQEFAAFDQARADLRVLQGTPGDPQGTPADHPAMPCGPPGRIEGTGLEGTGSKTLPSPVGSGKRRRRNRESILTGDRVEWFPKFWELYYKREDRIDAERKFEEVIESEAHWLRCLEHLKRLDHNTEYKYRKLPATWLNKTGFKSDDNLPAEPPPPVKPQEGGWSGHPD